MTDNREPAPADQVKWSHNLASLHPKVYSEMREYYFPPERAMMLLLLSMAPILPFALAVNRLFPISEADTYVAIYDLVISLIFAAGAVMVYRSTDYEILDKLSWALLFVIIPAMFYLRYTATLDVNRSDYISLAFFLDIILVSAIYAVLSLSPLIKFASATLYLVGVVIMYSSQTGLIPGERRGLVVVTLGYIFGSLIGFAYATLVAKTRFFAFQSLVQEKILNSDLTDALERVKTLSGMLPICAQCKKVRDDQGYWEQIEHYITEHSEAEFTHSICPDCAKELYPGLELPGS